MLESHLSASQEQRQELSMSTRQLQSLEILHAPLQELQLKLAAELAANPVLEADISETEIPVGDPLSAPQERDFDPDDDEGRELDLILRASEQWHDQLPLPGENRGDSEGREHFFNSLSSEVTLQEQLLNELNLADLPPEIREIAAMVIGSIDDSGYLRTPAADIAMALDVTLPEVEAAIRAVQAFDPPGVGASSLGECLKLQLQRAGEDDPVILALLDHHLEEIGRNKLPRVARALDITLPELELLLARLARLNPYPGTALSPADPAYVIPEAVIRRDEEGDYQLNPANRLVRLHIPERYLRMFDDPELAPEDRAYIRDKVAAARELIRALEQRESTIRRIAQIIIDRQRDFLDRGVAALRPMTMRQAADELGLHETTVSRAVSGKYLETPQGIFEFKYFFSGGYRAEDGAAVSSRSVQDLIRRFIEAENPDRPLSDEKLAQSLKAEGLSVARRTVAKYREELGIPATHLRRRHQ